MTPPLALHTMSGTLTPSPPFDFARTLGFAEDFTPTRGEQQVIGDALTKAVYVGGRLVVFRVASSGTVAAPSLSYTLSSVAPLAAETVAASEIRIRCYLSLDDDLRPFYAAAEADAPFAPLVKRLYGLHQMKFLTPFENAAWAILTQRTPIPMAQRVKRSLVERYGGALTVEGVEYRAFPEARTLAEVVAADPAEFASIINNDRKAPYLEAVTRAFADVDEGWLRGGDYDAVEAWLRAIPGIGQWSAAFVLVRGLGRMERLIASDPLLKAAARVYGEPMTAERFHALGARYDAMRGYWGFYLRVGW